MNTQPTSYDYIVVDGLNDFKVKKIIFKDGRKYKKTVFKSLDKSEAKAEALRLFKKIPINQRL